MKLNFSKHGGKDDHGKSVFDVGQLLHVIGNVEYEKKVQTMFAKYQQLRAGGAPTVTK